MQAEHLSDLIELLVAGPDQVKPEEAPLLDMLEDVLVFRVDEERNRQARDPRDTPVDSYPRSSPSTW
ncbi:MAG TPA: hypothetical protein VME22_15835 [Solirubrobacteraceae bacterium]|nr:hypothetical protein [Solirubrobacteraceae bacterium]